MPTLATLQAKLIALGVIVLITAAGTSFAAFKIHTWRVASLRVEWAIEKQKAIDDVKVEMQKMCDKNNLKTKDESHALQSRADSIADMYVELLNSADGRKNTSTPSGDPRGHNEAPGANVSFMSIPVVDGLRAGKLNDEQASALIGCQDRVADIYCENGQGDLLPAGYQCPK